MGRDKEKNRLTSQLRSMTNAASRMNISSSKTYVNNFEKEKATFNKNTKVAASLTRNINSRRSAPPNLGKLTTSTGPRPRKLILKFPKVKQSSGAKKCELEATTVQVLNSKSFDPSVTNFDEKEQRDTFNENTKVAACPTTKINSPSASTSNLGRLATLTRPRRHFHSPAVKQSSGEKKCAPLITSVQVPTSWSFVPSTISSDQNINSRRLAPPNLGKLTTSTGPRPRKLILKFPNEKQSSGGKKCELEATTVQVLNSKSFDPSVTNFDEKEQRDRFNENRKVAACPTTKINSPSASTSNFGRLATLTRPRILGATSVENREFENFDAMHASVVGYLRKNKFNFNDPQIPHDRILSLRAKMFYVVSQDLVNVSSYFQTLFGTCKPEAVVKLPTFISVTLLSAFLKFIYNDPSLIKPTSHKFPGMLKSVFLASQKFEAPTVEKTCTNLLVSTVSPNNVDLMYKLAHACNIELLKVRVDRLVFKLVHPSANSWNLGFLIPMMKAITVKSLRDTNRRSYKYLVALFDCLLGGSPSEDSKVVKKKRSLITKSDVDRACKTKYGHLFDQTDVLGRKVNQSEFGLFLQYMESEDNFDVSQIDSVIKLALLFNMEELVESGKKLILGNLKKNFFTATKIAFLYDLDDLKEKIIELVVRRAGNSTSMDNDSRFVWNSEYFLANSEKFKALPQSLKKNIIVSILGFPDLAFKAHGL